MFPHVFTSHFHIKDQTFDVTRGSYMVSGLLLKQHFC